MSRDEPPGEKPDLEKRKRAVLKQLAEVPAPPTLYRDAITFRGRDGKQVTIHVCRTEETPDTSVPGDAPDDETIDPPRKREE